MGFEWDRRGVRGGHVAPVPSQQQRAEEPCWAACPPQTELLMLLLGSMNSGFSCPSEPVLVPHPHAQHSAEQHGPEPPALELIASCCIQPQMGPGGPCWEARDPEGRGNAPFSSLQCKQKPKRTKFQSSYSSPGATAPGGGMGTVTCWRDWMAPVQGMAASCVL